MAEPDSTTESSSTPASSPPLPAGKDYHAFICFNIADQEWVDDTVAYLESPEIGFKCVDHRSDFIPGKSIIRNIDEFIEKSWKYVLVMTPDFLESDMCNIETDIMMKMSAEQKEECVIPVLLKPCRVPRALSSLTYIDVGQSEKWKGKLVQALRRKDIKTRRVEFSTDRMAQLFEETKNKQAKYQDTIDQYKQDKGNLEAEKKTMESQVNNAFDTCISNILTLMEKLRQQKIDDVHILTDRKLSALVQKRDTAQKVVSYLESDIKHDTQALKNFTSILDEIEELERRQRETSYTEFVASTSLVEKMAQLMSEFEPGYLREMNIAQIKTQEDRDNFLKEISPSWAVLPKTVELTPWSIVRCPHFQFDPRTVRADRSILPDGSLYNQPPSRPHPQSDRRLKKYSGAVGTTKFIRGRVYYWQNSVDVDLEEELEERDGLFEVGLSTQGVIDDKHILQCTTGTTSMVAMACTDHTTDSVCLKVYEDAVLINHQPLHPNTRGHWPHLMFGFLLDTVRNRWTIYDVIKQEEITTVEGIGDVEEFTPMFGAYAHITAKIKLSLITGTDLNISDDMYRLIQTALE